MEKGLAYRCNCSRERLETLREEQMQKKEKPRYDGHCREKHVAADEPHVIRFRNPESGDVVFRDHIRGDVRFSNSELDDLIIRRTDGSPTYNLTVVIDDADMAITHVIRGDDHLNNTPRQINLLQALDLPVPEYAHLPMILGDDGARLSKRHGAVSVMQYREEGYLPEALLNYLVRLGWSHGDQELFTTEEMIRLFDLRDVNRASSSFNTEKLQWINQQYIKESDLQHLAIQLAPHLQERGIDVEVGDHLVAVCEAQRERARTLTELAEISSFYYEDFEEFDPGAAKKAFKGDAANALRAVSAKLAALSEWQRDSLHAAIADTVDELGVGFGKVAMPLRVAVTGGAPSPDLDLTLWLIGREVCLRRIGKAISFIESAA
jgi:glutamyl-tRNA synthetase